jgi:hypothetical protein
MRRCTAIFVLASTNTFALGQVANHELESNETKATATLAASGGAGMNVGDYMTGLCTGSSTTPGDASKDVFLVRTAPLNPGLYRHRLLVSSATTGHSARMMGLSPDGSPSETAATVASQSGSGPFGSVSPAHTLQWYSFGGTSQLYVEVRGTSTPPSQPYTVTYTEALSVTPTTIGPFTPGPISLTTDLVTRAGDTKLVVYDSQFDLVRQMDGVPGGSAGASTLAHSFTSGEYYVGVAIVNLATHAPKEAGDPASAYDLNQFPGVVTSSHPFASNLNISFNVTDSNGTTLVPAMRTQGFEIVWFKMVVGTPPTCGTSDFNGDADFGTDADIEAFFACLGGNCCASCWSGGSDFNGDGDFGTDQDIESFFRVLGGGIC